MKTRTLPPMMALTLWLSLPALAQPATAADAPAPDELAELADQLVRHQGPEHPGTGWHARATEALFAGLAQADGLNELERPASTLAALVAAGVPGHEPAARAAGIVLAAMTEAARAGHPPGQLEVAGEGLFGLAGVLSAEDIPRLAIAITASACRSSASLR